MPKAKKKNKKKRPNGAKVESLPNESHENAIEDTVDEADQLKGAIGKDLNQDSSNTVSHYNWQ